MIGVPQELQFSHRPLCRNSVVSHRNFDKIAEVLAELPSDFGPRFAFPEDVPHSFNKTSVTVRADVGRGSLSFGSLQTFLRPQTACKYSFQASMRLVGPLAMIALRLPNDLPSLRSGAPTTREEHRAVEVYVFPL